LHEQVVVEDERVEGDVHFALLTPEPAFEERQAAILNFAIRLSRAPSEAGPEDMCRLRDAGLSDEEILDLILSASLFGWANRLMHTLGDPIAKDGPDSGSGR
jgi:uncharacterized peroxidase-related enzyme